MAGTKVGGDPQEWLNQLDNMGPFAPVEDLQAHLDSAPNGVDPAALEELAEQIAEVSGKRPMVRPDHGSRECGFVVC